METFSASLAICAGKSQVPWEFPAQRPVTRSFDFFFDLRLHKRLSKRSWGWLFETLSCPLWRHCNDSMTYSNDRWRLAIIRISRIRAMNNCVFSERRFKRFFRRCFLNLIETRCDKWEKQNCIYTCHWLNTSYQSCELVTDLMEMNIAWSDLIHI